MKYLFTWVGFLLLLLTVSCKKPYSPDVITSNQSFLVVEGFISINDTTIVTLSHTVKISDKSAVNPVTGAAITVEDDQNGSFALTEGTGGRYKLGNTRFDASHKYRLRIKTGNKEYLSDYVQPVITPPIDSVGYTINNNSAQFYVNTHASLNDTRYYRWDYGETWIIHTKFISLFKAYKISDNNRIGYRSLGDEINQCWSSDTSSTITLGTSEKLTQNVIANQTIISVPLSSEKFTERYSILVNQYAMSKDAYTFYQNVKKNTEELGGIFDAQPSKLTTNIHCLSNPNEPVIGFITAGSVSHKRIFVNPTDLPQTILDLPYRGCVTDTLLFTDPYFTRFFSKELIPVDAIVDPVFKNDTLGYTGSSGVCVDCTLRGTNKKPAFWK